MSDSYLIRTSERIRSDLEPGEEVTHAVLAFRIGGSRDALTSGTSGIGPLLGLTAGSAIETRDTSALNGQELTLPKRVYVVLTTKHLMIYTLGGVVVAKPGELIYGFPLNEIAWLAEPRREGSLAHVLRVELGTADGSRLRWEFPRVQVVKGMELLRTLRQYVPDEMPGRNL